MGFKLAEKEDKRRQLFPLVVFEHILLQNFLYMTSTSYECESPNLKRKGTF